MILSDCEKHAGHLGMGMEGLFGKLPSGWVGVRHSRDLLNMMMNPWLLGLTDTYCHKWVRVILA